MATKETKLIDKKSIKELVDILDEMELTTVFWAIPNYYFCI